MSQLKVEIQVSCGGGNCGGRTPPGGGGVKAVWQKSHTPPPAGVGYNILQPVRVHLLSD